MSLLNQIDNDLKEALKSKDKIRAQTIRSLKSAIKYAEIEEGGPLDEPGVLGVIAKQAKQRRDAIAEFQKGGRDDLVESEAAELAVLETYLPEPLSESEIEAQAEIVIKELGATGMKSMGQVMNRLMDDLKGQADGKVVSQVVRRLLS